MAQLASLLAPSHADNGKNVNCVSTFLRAQLHTVPVVRQRGCLQVKLDSSEDAEIARHADRWMPRKCKTPPFFTPILALPQWNLESQSHNITILTGFRWQAAKIPILSCAHFHFYCAICDRNPPRHRRTDRQTDVTFVAMP